MAFSHLQGTLDPRGGGLKQIDPARAPPRHGIAVQVGPGFKQECHAPSGDWNAGFKLVDCLDDECQAVFLGHASRFIQNTERACTGQNYIKCFNKW
jgi:hypothetical protein